MTIEQLMVDSIDMHVHCAPDPFGQWRIDALQLAQQAREAGMKAVVIKSHYFGTANLAWMVNRVINNPILVGSLTLDRGAGGMNPDVVEAHIRAGAKVIWMPTTSAAAHIRDFAREQRNDPFNAGRDVDDGISIIDKEGKLLPQIERVLEVIRANKVALATGHVSIAEVFAIAGEALRQQVNVIVTHPFARLAGPSLTIEQARQLVSMGAYIEFDFCSCMPPMRQSPADMVNYIKTLGPEHCLLSTDFGQARNPPPTEGFRMMLANMLRFDLSEEELSIIVKVNPARLLNLAYDE
jgi:hypothetical protein